MAKSKALIVRSKGKTAILPEGRALIESMAAEGNDQRTICKALGISRRTLVRCRERDEKVEDAWADGHAQLSDTITHLLLQAGQKGNVIALIFLAKCRLGWIDQPKAEAPAPSVVINLPESRTPEEHMKLLELELVPQDEGAKEKSDVFGPLSKKVVVR